MLRLVSKPTASGSRILPSPREMLRTHRLVSSSSGGSISIAATASTSTAPLRLFSSSCSSLYNASSTRQTPASSHPTSQSSHHAHPTVASTGFKSTLPSSSEPIKPSHAFQKLQKEQRKKIDDGDRGYLAFTKSALYKLTLPLHPPDEVHDPESLTSKASSPLSKAMMEKAARQDGEEGQQANNESENDSGPIDPQPWESRVDKGEQISQVNSPDSSKDVKRRGKSGKMDRSGEEGGGLHGPENGEPADEEAKEFDSKAPGKSVVFLLHSGQPLSYISSLIRAEEPSYSNVGRGSSKDSSKQNDDSPHSHEYDPTITFHTRVGDGKRWSPAIGMGDFLRDAARIGSFVIKIGSREVRVTVPSFEDRTRFLRSSLYSKMRTIEKMAKLKAECDKLAAHGTRRFAYGGAGILIVWWCSVAYGTFMTPLGWDVLEPVTYLAGLGSLMVGYSWFLVTSREVSYRSVLNETTTKRQQRLYGERGFNVELFQDLIEETKQLRKAIKSVAEDYDLEWNQGETEAGKQNKRALDVVRKAEARDEAKDTRSKRKKEKDDEASEEEDEEGAEEEGEAQDPDVLRDEDGDGRPDGQSRPTSSTEKIRV